MMRALTLLIPIGCFLQACDTPANKAGVAPSMLRPADPRIATVQTPYTPSPEEQAAIDKLVGRHPGRDGERIRATLNDPEVAMMELSNPEDQRLLNEIFLKREVTRGALRAEAARTEQLTEAKTFSVTLALVPSLGGDGKASARVIRRRNPEPHELIVLPEGTADIAAFGTALTVLTGSRATQGQLPSGDFHLDIEGARVPDTWDAATQADAKGELQRLKEARVRNVPGVGQARTTEILARSR